MASSRGSRFAGEATLWLLAVALLSPLVWFVGKPTMPLWCLFAVAGGIALALALAGRQLHGILLSEAISGRTGTAKVVLAAGMILLVLLLVLLAAVVALVVLLRQSGLPPAGSPPLRS